MTTDVARLAPDTIPEKPKKKLSLDRTTEYIKASGIDKMTGKEIVDFLLTQTSLKIALLGEAILHQLELLENAETRQERQAISLTIGMLTKCSSELTQTRIQFEKSAGVHMERQLEEQEQHAPPPPEMSPEEFSRAYEEAMAATGDMPTKPAEV